MTFEYIQKHPLWGSIQKKFPYRDYEFQFGLLIDWYSTKKKKLPKNISAFTNWLSKTQIDPELRNKAELAHQRAEQLRQREEVKKPVSPETMENLRKAMIEKVGRPFPKHEANTHDRLNNQANEAFEKYGK